ncbi:MULTISPECIES: DUF6578 domain-containing protein [Streptomyces]|uniref:DUF6578 domain-containing protein n=1 Tax=Streptomyces TaxID=1883 RepID=UPI002F934921
MEADPEDYADLVGRERADAIGFREEHHGQGDGRVATSVEVVSIAEVHCRCGVPPGAADRVNCSVPDTAVLAPVEETDGWARPGRSCNSRAAW